MKSFFDIVHRCHINNVTELDTKWKELPNEMSLDMIETLIVEKIVFLYYTM